MADTKPADNNFIVQVPYNGTGATGGNPLVDNLNIWYQVGLIGARVGIIRQLGCKSLTLCSLAVGW